LKKLIIFDLDGVIYRGDAVLPHAAETVNTLRGRGFGIRFLTNNSTRSRAFYGEKLNGMGVRAEPAEIMTSNVATLYYLKEKSPDGARVYVVGEQGIYDELKNEFTIVSDDERETADYVVVGYDRNFNFDKLTLAFEALQAGAELVATNRDPTFPMPNGRILPGGGAIVAALAAAWEREPYTAGKPNPLGIVKLMEGAGAAPEETLLIGDRAATDVVTGRAAGVETCLVLTGVTAAGDVAALPPEQKPDYVIEHLGQLPSLDYIADGAADSYKETKNEAKHIS
jgi:phosphoglycolate/pyridoxal phosphate phosphatase family enzyme